MNLGHIKNIHFVGIGGIGMSGIAEILSGTDVTISGCDLKASSITERLEKRGMRILAGHDPSHLAHCDLVVISSAVRQDNPEVQAARAHKIPVIKRAEMLGELTRLGRAVCIAGTHGKTTTSAMTGAVLSDAGLDPTLIIGGIVRDMDTNARRGSGETLVVEADEYDRTFLVLHPTIAVITNIEADHLDIYRDLDDIRDSFRAFAHQVPISGEVIGCADDPNVVEMLDAFDRQVILYGLGQRAELRATNLIFEEAGTHFEVAQRGEVLGSIGLRVPGEHNVRNALAATAVGLALNVPFATIARALGRFGGVERRFQILGEFRGALIVDDYAHHPTEIRATLEAARRSYPSRRIVALFQPHLYSRTRDFYTDFADSLGVADLAYVSPIYPAREEPIEGVSSHLITDAARERGVKNVAALDQTNAELTEHFRDFLGDRDLFVTMGAGDVNRISESLAGGQR